MNSNEKDGLRYPSIDQLVEKTNSKYRLVVGAAKRAKELERKNNPDQAMVENPRSQKHLGVALEEIVEGKLKVVDTSNQSEDE